MSNLTNNMNSSTKNNDTVNIRTELYKYIMHWRYFVLSIILTSILGIIFIKSTPNLYVTKATLLIKEDGAASSELKMFQDLSPLDIGGTNNVYDEIEVLKSRSLARKYAEKLNLNFEIYGKVGLKNVELYEKSPVKYNVLSNKNAFYQLDTFMDIRILDNYEFKYILENSDDEITSKFGEEIKIGKHSIILSPTKVNLEKFHGKSYHLNFSNIKAVVERFKVLVGVNIVDDYSNIIELGIEHTSIKKGQDVLNEIIELYNLLSVEDQNLVGEKTGVFITKRLELVKEELDQIDKLEEIYKSQKKITDISAQSQIFVDAKSTNEQDIFDKKTQLRLVEFMIEEVQKEKKDFELLPASIGINSAPQLSLYVADYNDLLFERNKNLRTSSISNPVVRNFDVQLTNSLDNIKASLTSTKKQLKISLNSLNLIEKQVEGRITNLPTKVREYRSILRRQSIVAELYAYLLKKKEENQISVAVTIPKSKIIDNAYSLSGPVFPNKKFIGFASILIGVLIPFIIIYLGDLFDTKFKTRSELEESITAPILGDIPFDTSGEKIVVNKGSRTSTAEAFRLLRTNIDFMLTPMEAGSKSIFVTSTISGEGKTFVAANVAASIALTGKKVLLTGLDLRAPKISQYLGLPNRKGVSNYLVDKNILLDDIISPLDGFDNLDFLSSGVVPPNPAELLLSTRMNDMFSELKEMYDYIVVDTAPVNLVTDTLMISQYADMFLYTVRSNYLEKNLLDVPERLYQEKRLPNMAVLLNGLDYTRGYGYGGYGYPKEDTHKNIFQRLFKK